MTTDDALAVLTEKECRTLLATQQVGHIGLSVGALPAIYPVRYRMDDGGIVVCPGNHPELVGTVHGGVVGFEVDSIDVEGRSGWSVLVVGLAKKVQSGRPGEPSAVEAPAGPEPDYLLRIEPALISGRLLATS